MIFADRCLSSRAAATAAKIGRSIQNDQTFFLNIRLKIPGKGCRRFDDFARAFVDGHVDRLLAAFESALKETVNRQSFFPFPCRPS